MRKTTIYITDNLCIEADLDSLWVAKGSHSDCVCEDLVKLAAEEGIEVKVMFNNKPMIAKPDSSPADVFNAWSVRRSLDEILNKKGL